MPADVSALITYAAIVVMAICLFMVLSLRKGVPGGVVGRQWRVLTSLVALFTAGYLVAPFFGVLPVETMRLIVSLIFLFGAIYVLITVRLVYRVIKELAG
jgi:hypothetical protein